MRRDETEIIVVGGGPAGSAAAITAARAGHAVTVIDKATFPRDKCCGDGLTAGALRHLEDLGFDPAGLPSWQPIDEVVIGAPSGRRVRFPLPASDRGGEGQYAAVARRRELDAALIELASTHGASILQRHALVSVEDHPDRVTVRAQGPDGHVGLDARYLIAADGMWSPTRKALDLADPGYRGDWHAFRQYFVGVSDQAQRELAVWFEPDLLPGYLWSFPLGDGAANVGFGVVRGDESVRYMKGLWTELLARSRLVDFLGPDARPEAPHRAWPIPARLGGLPLTFGRILFVGDAAGATDPMTGEGIGQAIETGSDAAAAIVAAGSDDPGEARRRYESGLRRGMSKDHSLARTLSRVLSSPRGAEVSIRIAGATGWTRRNFARWLFEDYPRATLGTPHRWHRRIFTSPGAFAP